MARSQRKQRRFRRLSAWQTLLAAGVAAAATVAAALIAALVSHGPAPNPGPPSPGPVPTLDSSAFVAITSWSETALPKPPGERYTFSGISKDLPAGSTIYVVAQAGQTGAAAGSAPSGWLVSDPGYPAADGRWHITWTLSRPPATARWTPVVWINDCAPGNACGGDPIPELESLGPHAVRIVGRTVGGR